MALAKSITNYQTLLNRKLEQFPYGKTTLCKLFIYYLLNWVLYKHLEVARLMFAFFHPLSMVYLNYPSWRRLIESLVKQGLLFCSRQIFKFLEKRNQVHSPLYRDIDKKQDKLSSIIDPQIETVWVHYSGYLIHFQLSSLKTFARSKNYVSIFPSFICGL